MTNMTQTCTQDYVSLKHILSSLSAPITEEHAWAIIYMAVSCLDQLQDDDLYLVLEPRDLLLCQDGKIHPLTFSLPPLPHPGRQMAHSKIPIVSELASVVYSALDFGVSEDEERILSVGLNNVINVMLDSDQDTLDDDEGIEEDSDSDVVICKVLDLCRNHLLIPGEAVLHYTAVCRALVNEVKEITQFMSGISELDGDLLALERGEWVNIWNEVMAELRLGIRLKKVVFTPSPAEFELTPYEMLMDSIRSKKYNLNPAPPRNVKMTKDAMDLILEFIRSRPPLKPAMDRQLKEKEFNEVDIHENLLSDIRGNKARQSLRKTPPWRPKESSLCTSGGNIRIFDEIEEISVEMAPKKIIDLDKTFAEHIFNFDDSPNNSSEEIVMSPCRSSDVEDEVMEKFKEENSKISNNQTKIGRMIRQEGQIWGSQDNNINPTKAMGSLSTIPTTSSVSTSPTISRLSTLPTMSRLSNIPTISGPSTIPTMSRLSSIPAMSRLSTLPTINRLSTIPTKYADWITKLHTLNLNLEEVSHMRHTMTKVELEDLELNTKDREALEKSKLCFHCRKVRFTIFHWGNVCQFCKRSVCVKCFVKIWLLSDKLREIPVWCLSHQLECLEQDEASCVHQTSSASNIAPGGFQRSWDRNSVRGPSLGRRKMSGPVGGGVMPSKSRLHRAKTMDKADRDKFRAIQLSEQQARGSRYNVCLDCRDLLVSIVKAQKQEAELKVKKKRLMREERMEKERVTGQDDGVTRIID